MSNLTKLFLFITSILLSGILYGQHPNTYALIIGVAKYQHPGIKHLKYADDDAIAFKRMLMSPAGGSVKPEFIKCFINDSATSTNILSSFKWISDSPKSGDRVIFYFSGHGDAVDPELVYLLTYDANGSDPNLYDNTAINMYKVKNMIKKIRMKGVDVVLITDACRSNELTSTTTSTMYAFESIVNKDYGEMRFSSSSANQKSTEDLRWGNGHGVFTYYLLQGWMGMANENDDNEITAGELFRYVTKKVKDATYDNSTKKTQQTPSTCCSQHEDIVLATIDSETLKRLKEVEDQIVVTDDVFAYVTEKSGADDYDEDTATMRLYNLLVGAIADKKILEPKNESALYYYNQLKKLAGHKPIFYDGEAELLAALNVSGQQVLTDFLNGNASNINSASFKSAFEFVMTGLSLIDNDDPNYTSLKVKALFLESQYLMFRAGTRQLALQKIDSAITMQPKASYLYYSKGIIHSKYLKYDSASVYFKKAIQLAPKWSAPYIQLAYNLQTTGFQLEAEQCMKDMLGSSDKAINYLAAGNFYYRSDSFNLAIRCYQQALAKDTNLLDAYTGLSSSYTAIFEDSLSDYYWEKAKLKSNNAVDFYENYALYHKLTKNYKLAADYYYELYKSDTTRLYYFVNYAEMVYLGGDAKTAEKLLEQALTIDPYYTLTYYKVINLLEGMGAYNAALPYYKYLLETEPGYNPAQLYFPFMKLNMIDSALFYMSLAEKLYPEDRFTLETRAYHYVHIEDYQKAVEIYEKLAAKNINTKSMFITMGWCYYNLGKEEECLMSAYKALKLDVYNVERYMDILRYMWHFDISKQKIYEFLIYPLQMEFGYKSEEYMELSTFYLLYLDKAEFVVDVAKYGMSLYPYEYKFPLYASIGYLLQGDKKSFYSYFEQSVKQGLTCTGLEEVKDFLPDPTKDKKYQKMSSAICN